MIDELAHLAEALSTLGDLTPRSLDAIASFGERMSSLLCVAAFRATGPAGGARRRLRRDDHRRRVHAAPSRSRDAIADACRASSFRWCATGKVPVLGGFIGSAKGTRHHHDARPRRQRLQRVAHRRRGPRRRDRDLDRRGRHAHRRSARRSERAPDRADRVRRSVGAGVVRREGAAPEHDRARGAARHSGLRAQLDEARRARARRSPSTRRNGRSARSPARRA